MPSYKPLDCKNPSLYVKLIGADLQQSAPVKRPWYYFFTNCFKPEEDNKFKIKPVRKL